MQGDESRSASNHARSEAGSDATTAGTGAGTVSGRIAMGAPGAVSTSSATLYSHASVYRQDDLEAIPGLAPRVGAVLRDNGIDNFARLAAMPLGELDRLVRSAGDDPADLGMRHWTELATLAAGHDWAGFAALVELRLRQGSGRPGAAGDASDAGAAAGVAM
jgi:predicted flap endonuclease-1-like 5' DNA nuclease